MIENISSIDYQNLSRNMLGWQKKKKRKAKCHVVVDVELMVLSCAPLAAHVQHIAALVFAGHIIVKTDNPKRKRKETLL